MMKQWTVGVLIPLVDGFYYGDIIWGLSQGAGRHGIRLMTVMTSIYNEAGERQPYRYRVGWELVDAWIIVADAVTEDYVNELAKLGKPIITITGRYPSITSSIVKCDNIRGAYDAVSHLITLGHRRIAFVGWLLDNEDFKERLAGYKKALSAAGIANEDDLVYNRLNGQQAADQMLEDGIPFTAVFAAADHFAVRMMDRLRASGVQVPDQLAVAGFDDNGASLKCEPPLTTVRQPIIGLGIQALEHAAALLEGRAEPTELLMAGRLIPRESSGSRSIDHTPNDQTLSWRNIKDEEIEQLIEGQSKIGLQLFYNQDMSWLKWTNQHWGCLGRWEADGGEGRFLKIDRAFSAKGDLLPAIGEEFRVEQFPPLAIMPVSSDTYEFQMAIVQPAHHDESTIGLIATVGPVTMRLLRGYDTRQFPPLVGIVTEFQSMLEDLRQREAYSQSLLNKLEVVSRTTNDGVYELDLRTLKLEWISGIESILGVQRSELPQSSDELITYVHAEDVQLILTAWEEHAERGKPFSVELRMRQGEGYIWISSDGEMVRNEAGEPLRFIGSVRNIDERKRTERQIHQLAYQDPLTGLPNRRAFYEELDKLLLTSENDEKPERLTILVIDLDHFKEINDSLGHDMGDLLLQHVAAVISAEVEGKGLVARIGGDEFMVMTPGLDEFAAAKLAESLLSKLQRPFTIHGHDLYATASIGLSVYPDNGLEGSTLIKMADTAMYRAKNQGRNRLESYMTSMSMQLHDRIKLSGGLRKAVEQMKEFLVYYQPQFEVSTGKLIGMEALLRWQHPVDGWIGPDQFIPIAEENGLIVPIGYWVLRESSNHIRKWNAGREHPLILSVNISARQLQQSEFSAEIKHIIEEIGVDPTHLCFEVTETAALQNINFAVRALQELKDYGIRIALDDFGTGHSSLSMLRHLPLQIVKIDRSFIRGMTSDRSSAAIIQAVIAMSKGLEVGVLAEGVETEDELALLRDMGCQWFQGYLASKPIPAEQFEEKYMKFAENVIDSSSTFSE